MLLFGVDVFRTEGKDFKGRDCTTTSVWCSVSVGVIWETRAIRYTVYTGTYQASTISYTAVHTYV